MLDWFFKKVTVASGVPALIAAAAFFVLGRPLWAAGTLAGYAWIYLNCFFLFRLIETAFAGKAPKNAVFVLTILKFPVLYAAGFFILKARVFPSSSILAGLTIFIAAFTVVWFVSNPAGRVQRSAS